MASSLPDISITAETRIGFIGAGRMAQALSKGLIDSGLVKSDKMIASDVDEGIFKFIQAFGVKTTKDNQEVVGNSDIIFIAVKPHIVDPVLRNMSPVMNSSKLVVSIAAGITLAALEKGLPQGSRVVRVMPNTPALVSCGASVYTRGSSATQKDGEVVAQLLRCVGICEEVPERLVDAVTGTSGSGPAYVFLAIEAMADGAVRAGIPRDLAQKLAAQTFMGAAKMVMDTGKHPGELKDAVCSPGGTTIAGVYELEKGGLRSSIMSAVGAAYQRAKELGEN